MSDDINEGGEPTEFLKRAEKRHEERGAEDYLRLILKSSQYIDNVAAVLETAMAEMEKGGDYKKAKQKRQSYSDLNDDEAKIYDTVERSQEASRNLQAGLEQAEQLATGSVGKLKDIQAIGRLKGASSLAASALRYIAQQRPTYENSLSEETIINAQAALDVVNTKLGAIARGDDKMIASLKEYNENYSKRMAAAQRDPKGGRIEGYRQRLAKKVEGYKIKAAEAEEMRTGIVSFREEEAKRIAAEQEQPVTQR